MSTEQARRQWSPPEILDLSVESQRDTFVASKLPKYDELDFIAEDIAKMEFTDPQNPEREQLRTHILAEGQRYGRWVRQPGSDEDGWVHYPPSDVHYRLRTLRNNPLLTSEEQMELRQATVAFVGLSVGSHAVLAAIRAGIGSGVALADFDVITPTNLNRLSATYKDLGMAKVDWLGREITRIDPFIEQWHLRQGFDLEAARKLPRQPQIIVEAIDQWAPKVAVRQWAKEIGAMVIMPADLDRTSQIDIEDPASGEPFFFGAASAADLAITNPSPQENMELLLKVVGPEHISPRFNRSFDQIARRESSGAAQLGSTAMMGGALVGAVMTDILLGRGPATGRYPVQTHGVFGLAELT